MSARSAASVIVASGTLDCDWWFDGCSSYDDLSVHLSWIDVCEPHVCEGVFYERIYTIGDDGQRNVPCDCLSHSAASANGAVAAFDCDWWFDGCSNRAVSVHSSWSEICKERVCAATLNLPGNALVVDRGNALGGFPQNGFFCECLAYEPQHLIDTTHAFDCGYFQPGPAFVRGSLGNLPLF